MLKQLAEHLDLDRQPGPLHSGTSPPTPPPAAPSTAQAAGPGPVCTRPAAREPWLPLPPATASPSRRVPAARRYKERVKAAGVNLPAPHSHKKVRARGRGHAAAQHSLPLPLLLPKTGLLAWSPVRGCFQGRELETPVRKLYSAGLGKWLCTCRGKFLFSSFFFLHSGRNGGKE